MSELPLAKTPKPNPYADAPRLPEAGPIDPRELVGAQVPVELEIGPGRGGFLFERLEEDAAVRIVGLEIRRKWATIVDRRLAERGFGSRARVFAEDARYVLPRFQGASVSRIFVHFPDPWWKKRHHKRLVVGTPLLDEVARVLVPTGEVFVQTDVEERMAGYEALFDAHAAFTPSGSTARVEAFPFAARSPRERRALTDGLPVYRLWYRRA
ncbi:MAG TPA: tRNA (guanine-N7)-methyltransferase [Polyangiaceae bacterium]|nr:tRNA (guanine-N7)-methyltransferase [Polyangiaceae bacterium]